MERVAISHVIPAHNEERYLPRTLAAVRRAAAAFGGGVELIVVDNDSGDATAEVAAAGGARVVREGKRCIAAVRNAGARAARGRILTFADADSMVSENFFVEAARLLDGGGCVGGNFAIRMDRSSLGIRVCVSLLLAVLRLWFRVAGGSYFCLRESFFAVGGFDERLTYAEDLAFARALRRYGKGRGLRYCDSGAAHIVTSTRKFDHYGDWYFVRFLLHGPLLLLGKRVGAMKVEEVFYRFDKSRVSKGFEENDEGRMTNGE